MELEIGLVPAFALFLFAAVVIIGSAVLLATSADVIADRSGWGRLWVGTLLLAGATSLPELVTNVTAVIIDSPGLAAGNIYGANMLNVSNLAVVIAIVGARKVYQNILPQQAFLLGLALVMTGVALLFTITGFNLRWGFISPAGLMILGVYAIGSKLLYKYSASGEDINPEEEEPTPRSLKWGLSVFMLAALVIFVTAPLLATTADRIALLSGISQSFIGVLLVSIVTTLPELTATITAMRIGAYDLAVSGMYGSNAFNVAALGVADFFSGTGSLFGSLNTGHVAAGSAVVLLMGMGLVQMLQRREVTHFSLVRPSTALVVGLYVVGLYLVFSLS